MSDSSSENTPTLVLKNLPSYLAEWLKSLPEMEIYSDPRAEERLFPDPAAAEHSDLLDDWKSFVQPELAELFRNAREVVRGDVAKISGEEDVGFQLAIPRTHFDAWIGTLNQCRLALGAIHNFQDGEFEQDLPDAPDSERSNALLQIHFFGYLQEILIKGME